MEVSLSYIVDMGVRNETLIKENDRLYLENMDLRMSLGNSANDMAHEIHCMVLYKK